MKNYHIHFFQLSSKPSTKYKDTSAILQSILDAKKPAVQNTGGYTRDIWRLAYANESFAGQFRKFRTEDLPEIGSAGSQAAEIELEEDEGVVESNFFVFFDELQILGWHYNQHANHPNQFAKFLSEYAGTKLSLDPIIQPNAVKRLMKGDVDLKKIIVTIPRPTNSECYPDTDFNKSLLGLMNSTSADSLHIQIGIDARRATSAKKLKPAVKRAMSELLDLGATTARAVVYNDDGLEHPIDLLADRITSTQEVETNGKYPPSKFMYKAIIRARAECNSAIEGYFGTINDALR